MTIRNADITRKFFSLTDAATKSAILKNIAGHYQITPAEALAEVTDPDAECLLDYITGPTRAGALALYRRHGLPLSVTP